MCFTEDRRDFRAADYVELHGTFGARGHHHLAHIGNGAGGLERLAAAVRVQRVCLPHMRPTAHVGSTLTWPIPPQDRNGCDPGEPSTSRSRRGDGSGDGGDGGDGSEDDGSDGDGATADRGCEKRGEAGHV